MLYEDKYCTRNIQYNISLLIFVLDLPQGGGPTSLDSLTSVHQVHGLMSVKQLKLILQCLQLYTFFRNFTEIGT